MPSSTTREKTMPVALRLPLSVMADIDALRNPALHGGIELTRTHVLVQALKIGLYCLKGGAWPPNAPGKPATKPRKRGVRKAKP